MAGTILKTAKTITKTAGRIVMNASNGDITLNAAKNISYSADKEIIHGSYTPPEKNQIAALLVQKVVCSVSEVEIGKTYTFKAIQFSRKATQKELGQVKWAYQSDDEGIIDFPNQGSVVGSTVVKKVTISDEVWDNKKITIYAYINDKESEGSIDCKVKFDRIELLLICYINEGHKGNTLMAEVAQTRLKNIKKSSWYDSSIHKVHCPPIQSIDEIIEIVPKYYKKYGGKGKVVIKEIGVVSHAGDDGPISYESEIQICPLKGWAHQMEECGWEQIDLLWVGKGAICVFYGCNTGHKPNGFAQRISKLSNFKDVEVWGQSTSSFPSFYPDYRVTSLARSMGTGWDLRGNSYLVGGNGGQGWEATSYKSNKNTLEEDILKEDFPKANPMNCFKNGTHVRETHQGYFNDHRK